jgi:hypothetical protein
MYNKQIYICGIEATDNICPATVTFCIVKITAWRGAGEDERDPPQTRVDSPPTPPRLCAVPCQEPIAAQHRSHTECASPPPRCAPDITHTMAAVCAISRVGGGDALLMCLCVCVCVRVIDEKGGNGQSPNPGPKEELLLPLLPQLCAVLIPEDGAPIHRCQCGRGC